MALSKIRSLIHYKYDLIYPSFEKKIPIYIFTHYIQILRCESENFILIGFFFLILDFVVFENKKYCLKKYDELWFKHSKCVVLQLKLRISYFDLQYLESCVNFNSIDGVGWKKGVGVKCISQWYYVHVWIVSLYLNYSYAFRVLIYSIIN